MGATTLKSSVAESAGRFGGSTVPIKYLFEKTKTPGNGSEELLSLYRDHGVVPKRSRDDNHNRASEDLSKYQIVESGYLVVNKMKAWQGSVAISAHRGIVSPAYFVYRPLSDVPTRYLHYVLRSDQYRQAFASISSGVRPNQWDLDPAAFERLPVAIPPASRSLAIADYLDHETAEIDAFIAEASKLIRLTSENYDSQQELAIGSSTEEHVKLKYLASIATGFPFKSTSFKELTMGRVPLLRGVNVAPASVVWDDAVALEEPESRSYDSYLLVEGDLVLGMDRPFINEGLRLAPISLNDQGALLVQRVARLRPNPNMTSSEWLLACLRGSRFKAYLEPDFTGVSVPHISPGQIGNFPIPLPPLSHQKSRLEALSNSEAASRAVVAEAREAISLARERRAALISAAVTGQIDVTQRHRPVAEQLKEEVLQNA